MATVYAGGARRSAAPQVSPRASMGTAVGTPIVQANDVLTQQILQSLGAPSASIFDGGGSGQSTAGQQAGTPGGLAQAGQAANAIGALGALTQNADLSQMAGMLGTTLGAVSLGGNLANAQSIGDVGKAVATSPTAMGMLGVPGLVGSAIAGGVNNGFAGAATNVGKGLAYGAMPALAVADAVMSLVGVQTLTDRVMTEINYSFGLNGYGQPGSPNAYGAESFGVSSPGDVTGTPLGAPTGPDVSFSDAAIDAAISEGFASDGGGGDFGGVDGYGGSSGDAAAAAAGAGPGGPGDDGDSGGYGGYGGYGGDGGDSGDSGW